MDYAPQKGFRRIQRLVCLSLLSVSFCTSIYADPVVANELPNPTPEPAILPGAPTDTTLADAPFAGDASLDAASSGFGGCNDCKNRDPLERINRVVFGFNDLLDTFILRPVATVYNAIMPKPLNCGVHNFFTNLSELPTIANDALQLNFYQMSNDMWRFGINTTVGIGGIFDIAQRIDLQPYSNDFGLTLAKWGWCDSTYIVLPFWGPNTFRDAIGLPVDYYAFSVYPRIRNIRTRYALYGLSVIDWRAQQLKLQCLLDEAAFDKYVFIRNAYLQRRDFQIEENCHLSCADKKPCAETDGAQEGITVSQ